MTTHTAPVIAAAGLHLEYRLGKQWLNVVRDVTLHIDPLEIHGLVGESGSGKSTLALALMRYLAPNARIASGSIHLDGDDLRAKSDAELRSIWGRRMNLVPQDPLAALNPAYTIGEQIAEITRLHMGLSPRDARDEAIEALRSVRIADPEIVARRYPHQLSGGMRQRVTIAMALSTDPRLLVLDEPTTALDVTTQAVILDLFRDLIKAEHAAALYVSHDLGTVAQLCDRVTVLYGGEVMETAPVSELYAKPLHPYTQGLLASLPRYTDETEMRLPTIDGVAPSLAERPSGCVFAPRCPVALDQCHTHKPPLESARDGRIVRCHRWQEIDTGELVPFSIQRANVPDAPPRAGYVLNAQHVEKRFGQRGLLSRLLGRGEQPVRAVDDVSVQINTRSTLGLVGESGSGKSTLARAIVALDPADTGKLMLHSIPLDLALYKRDAAVLRELQMVFQNPQDALNPYMTIGQSLARTVKLLDKDRSTPDSIQARVIALLEAVRLTAAYAQRYPTELSGGEKQRVAIARAFAANPALVVADEPTSSLDVSVQAVVLNLLKDLRAREGASYLLISHDLDVVAYLADWIAVMYLGQVVEEGPTDAVYGLPSHPYTEALISAIPSPDPNEQRAQIRLEGEVPSARDVPSGCRFHTRCPRYLGDQCRTQEPPWRDAGGGHSIRCHIPIDELREAQRYHPETDEEMQP